MVSSASKVETTAIQQNMKLWLHMHVALQGPGLGSRTRARTVRRSHSRSGTARLQSDVTAQVTILRCSKLIRFFSGCARNVELGRVRRLTWRWYQAMRMSIILSGQVPSLLATHGFLKLCRQRD